MLRILSGYLSDSYFCSSLASLNIQADEGGVRTIAILYLICLFLFFFCSGNIALSQIAWKNHSPSR